MDALARFAAVASVLIMAPLTTLPGVQAADELWMTLPEGPPMPQASVAIPDGEHDEAIKREHTEKMPKLISGAKLVILPEVSHFAFWQNPELFNKAVLDFLAGS